MNFLLVSDWVADAEEVAGAAQQTLSEPGSEITIVVPAWLHGLDWAGDPGASVPCATRHLELLTAACRARGLQITRAAVGDPHPATAILDAIAEERYERVFLAREPRHLPRLPWLGLERRIERACAVPVDRVALGRPRSRHAHHCAPEARLAV
jgi:hypothetical protein